MLAFVIPADGLYAWNIGVDFAAKDRIATRHKVTFVIPLPKRYIDDIQKPHPGT
jgi:putative ABC transport system permease protein